MRGGWLPFGAGARAAALSDRGRHRPCRPSASGALVTGLAGAGLPVAHQRTPATAPGRLSRGTGVAYRDPGRPDRTLAPDGRWQGLARPHTPGRAHGLAGGGLAA